MTRRTGTVGIDFDANGAKLVRAVDSIDRRMGRMTRTVRRVSRSFVGLGTAVAGAQIVRRFRDTAVALERVEIRLRRIRQTDALRYLARESDRLGLNLRRTADDYSLFASQATEAGLAVAAQRDIFNGVLSASAALQLSIEDTSGVLRALTQIVTKNRVQTEELLQISERGIAIQSLFARALGLTAEEFDKVVRSGTLGPNSLVALGEELQRTYGDDAVAAADSYTAAWNRLDNQWTEFAESAGPAVLGILSSSLSLLNELGKKGGINTGVLGVSGAFITEQARNRNRPVSPGGAGGFGLVGFLAGRDSEATTPAASTTYSIPLGPGGQGQQLRRVGGGFVPDLRGGLPRELGGPTQAPLVPETMGARLEDLGKTAKDTFDDITQYAVQAERNIQTQFADSIYLTMTGRFDDIGRAWADLMLRMASERLASTILGALFGDAAGGGGLAGALGSLFGGGTEPGKQTGGNLSAGGAYPVGEGGPELFIPGVDGALIPHGGGVNMQNSYDFRGASPDIMRALPAMLDRRDAALMASIYEMMRSGRAPIRRS